MKKKLVEIYKNELKSKVESLNKIDYEVKKYVARITKLENELSEVLDGDVEKKINNEFEQISAKVLKIDQIVLDEYKLIEMLSNRYLDALFNKK